MGGIGLGTGGMGMGFPYGGFSPYGYPGGGYGPSYAGSKISYFKSVFNASDFSHQEGYYQTVGMTKRMDEYKSKVFRSNYPDIMSSTFTDSKGVLGYYKKNGRKFILIEFLK